MLQVLVRARNFTLGGAAALALLTPIHARAAAAPGDILVVENAAGKLANIRDGGDITGAPRFATGLSGPRGICQRGPGGPIYVTESGSGEVTDVKAGGNLGVAPPFATGLSSPEGIWCDEQQVLVIDGNGVKDISAGGDMAAAPRFATGLSSPTYLTKDSQGRI